MIVALALPWLAAILIGCAASSGAEPPNGAAPPMASRAATPTGSASAGTSIPATPIPPAASTVVELARQDLAKRASISADRIQVIQVEAVEWPTSALGCPQPGRLYAQVVTPGFRIVLEGDGQTYEYHSDRGRRIVTCSKP